MNRWGSKWTHSRKIAIQSKPYNFNPLSIVALTDRRGREEDRPIYVTTLRSDFIASRYSERRI